ncbi:SpaA isopeptide-forming pilin-related protein [Chitinophaga sp.]|uniref:MSCRAMM family protein n=1 Tax=Chitinophaga sp. TaxID=1869181 RepID=UPI002F92F758
MKKLITLFICAILFVIGCNKFGDDFEDDLQGDATISGKLNYRDNISGSGTLKLMAGTKVFIGKDTTDYNNYLYYSVTDAQGNFTFKRLKKGSTYLLFVSDTIDGVAYSTYITRSAPADSVTLLAENDTIRQNGLLLYVLNSEQQPLKGAKIWLYNNKEVFESDTADNSNSIKDSITDQYGRVIFYNYKAGNYYVRAKFNSPNGIISADTTFTFSGKGISRNTVLLSTALNIKNTLLLTVVDESGALLPGINCCIFNNPLLFNQESCDGSSQQKSSGNDGTIKLTNLQAGDYYVYAQTKLNNVEYKGKLNVAVTATGTTSSKIIMKKTAVNTMVVRTVNEAGNPIPGVDFCVFNNPLLFNQEDCAGKYRDSTTSSDGTIKLNSLPAGNYYLYATVTQGTTHYKAKATIFVNATGETPVDLILKKETPSSELLLTAIDNAGTPVNGTSIYFFTSRSLWALDNISGSVRDTITGNNGSVTVQNLPQGKYYIRARVELNGQIAMKGADSVNIPAAPAKVSQTILVQ